MPAGHGQELGGQEASSPVENEDAQEEAGPSPQLGIRL